MSHRNGPVLCEWVLCSCAQRFQRPAGETYVTCLSCQTRQRLAAAGIKPGDPALAEIAGNNAGARRKAGTENGRAAA